MANLLAQWLRPLLHIINSKGGVALYFLWKNKPRAVLGHAFNWIPGNEIGKRLEEVGCFMTADDARAYLQANYPRSGVSVLNKKVFQQKIKTKKLPQLKAIEFVPPDKGASGDGHLVYAEYLERVVGDAVPGANTVIFPPANVTETSSTELLRDVQSLLEQTQRGISSLTEREDILRDKVRQLDLITSDRLHQAEFYDLSDEAAAEYVAALKENQVLRRRYKNELAAVLVAKEALRGVDCSGLEDALKQIAALGKQSYHCRVLTEKDTIVKLTKQNYGKEAARNA